MVSSFRATSWSKMAKCSPSRISDKWITSDQVLFCGFLKQIFKDTCFLLTNNWLNYRMNMKSALILMFLTVLATTSNINQTKLTPLQSKHIFNLFKEQKLGLIFDYQQDLYTSGTLFRLKHGNDIVFSLSTDKDVSIINFKVAKIASYFRNQPRNLLSK